MKARNSNAQKLRMRLVYLAVSIWATSSFAQVNSVQIGNGGDAVVCRDPSGGILSAEAFDRYEARQLRGILPRFPASTETRAEYFQEIFSRLRLLSPLRAQEYSEQAASFEREALFLTGHTLVDVPDFDPLIFPSNCEIEQLVIQVRRQFPEDKRYIVNQDIWVHLPELDRAIVITHEVILREMMAGDQDIQTRELRYLNSLLFSGKVLEYSYAEFYEVLVNVPGLRYFEHPGVIGRIPRPALQVIQGVGFIFNPDYRPGYFQRILKGYEGIILDSDSIHMTRRPLFYSIGPSLRIFFYDPYRQSYEPTSSQLYWADPSLWEPDEFPGIHHIQIGAESDNPESSIRVDSQGLLTFEKISYPSQIFAKGCIIEPHMDEPLFLSGTYSQLKKSFERVLVPKHTKPIQLKFTCGQSVRIETAPAGSDFEIL